MKIVAALGDGKATSQYRCIWPAEEAQKHGVDIECHGNIPVKQRELDTPHGKLVDILEIQMDFDVFIVQRPVTQSLAALCNAVKLMGKGLVVEVDDNFHALHRDSIARHEMSQTQNPTWLEAACELADVVTTTTPMLAGLYGRGKAHVLPNTFPRRMQEFMHGPEHGTRLGWSGSAYTHHADLEEMRSAFKGNGRSLNVVGYRDMVAERLKIDQSRITATSWVHDIDGYFEAVGDGMDIGLIPLGPGPFNDSKSILTGTVMAALGIPFIASPTAPYARLAAHGVGIQAKGGAWDTHVRGLSNRASLWSDYRDRGLEWAEENAYIEDNWESWADAWASAI